MTNQRQKKTGLLLIIFAVTFMITAGFTAQKKVYAQDTVTTPKTVRILFIGNSHTYYNNMPEMVKGLAKADGIECEISSITASSYKLSKFANKTDAYGAKVYSALTTSKWDYVVLQENRKTLVESETSMESSVSILHKLIKDAGAKMVIYATHPDEVGNTFTVNSKSIYLTNFQIEQILTRRNFKVSNDYEGLVAASGTNFMRTIIDHPEIPVYRSDKLHPTVQGSYLAACTIYYTIFNKSPYGNEFMPQSIYDDDNLLANMTGEEATTLQEMADGYLTLNKYSSTINKGESAKLNAVFNANRDNEVLNLYTNKILWDSVDLSGVSINRMTGEYTALKTGKYLVMATTDSGLIRYSTINVKQPATALEIKEDKIIKLVSGGSKKYTTTMEPSDTTDKITWTSNYPEIATVSSSGNVAAKTVGIAKITATTTSGIKAYRYVRVKLKAPTNVKVKKLSTKAKSKKYANIKVSWKKNSKAVKYYVYRKSSTNKTYKRIATTTTAKYTDKNKLKKRTYYYKIKAIYSNTKLNSDNSSVHSINI